MCQFRFTTERESSEYDQFNGPPQAGPLLTLLTGISPNDTRSRSLWVSLAPDMAMSWLAVGNHYLRVWLCETTPVTVDRITASAAVNCCCSSVSRPGAPVCLRTP
jgi:hypothetical protein